MPSQPESALNLSVPLDQSDAPIVRYLRKGEQLIDGIDYRGAPVLAAALSVPRTDWVLIAKLDRAQALGGIPAATIFTSVATLAGLIALIAIIAYLWQRRRLHAALAAVSQRQAAELAAAKFRDTFEQAAVGIAHIGLDGRTLQANREYCRIQGKTLEELRNDHVIAQNAAADQEGDHAILDEFKRGERNTFHGERHVMQPDGSMIWIDISTSLVRDDAGQPAYLINVTMDITERKNAETHLRQAEAVFRHTQEGIVVTDTRGMIVAVNPSFQRITGYQESELIGQNMRILQSGQHDADFYRDMWLTIDRKGSWQGEIWNRRKSGEPYPEFLTISVVRNAAGVPVNYVGTFVDITGIKESESRLVHIAHHDPLTDLPNRLLAMQRLTHAIQVARRKKRTGAVLFLDLDRFKNVNDSLGHPAGDELLLAVTRRLGDRLRESDTLARLGGDEFLVLVEDIEDSNAAAALAQLLLEQFDAPFALTGGHEVYIGTSIGISVFPDDGEEADEVVKNADAALYRAKEDGRGIYRFYTAALTDKANERLSLERRLRRAIERDEFLLHYQPLVRIKDRRIIGFEALVRWQEPGNGLVPPGKFIPLAEETGIILPLGDWVLREACRQMKIWRDAGHDLGTIAVNLSPRQFHLPDIDSIVGDILRETDLSPHLLELELTESALIEQGVGAETRLAALRKLGARVAIDDFGTGYSSLAYLKRFPISKLKIDQSFVRDISTDPADREITSAIIGLARNLHLESIAEGVETEAQLAYLDDQGCEFAQGYLFSRPLPASEIDALLRRGVLSAPALSA
jgi:diguanylate cyclase (GGDEF)-like protein/PAS domain S-box-containing protein